MGDPKGLGRAGSVYRWVNLHVGSREKWALQDCGESKWKAEENNWCGTFLSLWRVLGSGRGSNFMECVQDTIRGNGQNSKVCSAWLGCSCNSQALMTASARVGALHDINCGTHA